MRRVCADCEWCLALWRSPIGWYGLVVGEGGVVEICSGSSSGAVRRRLQTCYPKIVETQEGLVGRAVAQLAEYFSGSRRRFDLPLDFTGLSPFAVTVLKTLCDVPFGRTVTYGELAASAGSSRGARAVGRVMSANPLPIVIPCHRVLGAGGKLTGYSGGAGLSTKEWLLRFEAGEAAGAD